MGHETICYVISYFCLIGYFCCVGFVGAGWFWSIAVGFRFRVSDFVVLLLTLFDLLEVSLSTEGCKRIQGRRKKTKRPYNSKFYFRI